jgi:hypothetical protein
VSFVLSRSLRSRLVVVALAGLVAAGLLTSSAQAETPAAPGRVSGLVLDRSNHRLPEATVILTDTSGAVAGSATTDEEGRWSIAAPQGEYGVAVTASEDGHDLSARVRQYTVGADTKLNLVLAGDPNERRAEPTGDGDDLGASSAGDSSATFTRAAASTQSEDGMVTFSGRLLDADGNPVGSRAAISLNKPQTNFYRDTVVAQDGSFSLEVWPGSYTFLLFTGLLEEDDDCYGCEPERIPASIHAYMVENLQLDGDRAETIRLPRPSRLSVTVVDPANRPMVGAWVSNQYNSGHPAPIGGLLFPGAATKVFSTVDQVTGTDGTVDLEFIPGAAPHSIWVEPPPGTSLPGATPFPTTASSLTIQLQDGPTLSGRLLRADGTRLGATDSDSYLQDDAGRRYSFAFTADGYAVTAPEGSYRVFLGVSHNEEGESSDYRLWSLESEPFDLTGDRTLDLTVPFGYARLWAVDEHGLPLEDDFGDELETGSQLTIADGIQARASTTTEGHGSATHLPVIGPSLAGGFDLDYDGAPNDAYVAPGEDTIIAFIAGTGPGGDDLPATTTTTTQPTTTTTRPTTTTTTTGGAGSATSNDQPAGPGSPQPVTATRTGYWALAGDGAVYNFGAAAAHGDGIAGAVDLEPTPTGNGYRVLHRNGIVADFGDAGRLGNVDHTTLAKGEVPASLSSTPSGKGYWVFTNRGRAIPFGDATFLGDVSDVKLNGPVLGSVATPTGQGYYMVASDGGIFTFGDAKFIGSMGNTKLNAPVQSLVPDSDGHGYWLVAADGGIFAFDAPFKGSLGDVKLNKPVVGMVRYSDGYLMVGADGGIFTFSSSPFAGSLGDKAPAAPVVAVAALP